MRQAILPRAKCSSFDPVLYLAFGLAISLTVVLSGCNNVASNEVIADSVSTYGYENMTCSQIESEIDHLQRAASQVQDKTGEMPALAVREGETIFELKKLIEEEKNINVLVLAANSDSKNKESNTIINSLVSQEITNIRVPVMIVPGNFSKDHIALIT